jgi:hypothetical protein
MTTVRLLNSQARLIELPAVLDPDHVSAPGDTRFSHKAVKVPPGMVDVDADYWALVEGNSGVRICLEAGWLQVVPSTWTIDLVPEETAIATVESATLESLQAWLPTEKRQRVAGEISKRIAYLGRVAVENAKGAS